MPTPKSNKYVEDQNSLVIDNGKQRKPVFSQTNNAHNNDYRGKSQVTTLDNTRQGTGDNTGRNGYNTNISNNDGRATPKQSLNYGGSSNKSGGGNVISSLR